MDAPAPLTAAPSDPVALVTGGSSGIGRAVVADLAAHGHDVVVLDRCPPAESFDDRVRLVLGDVRNPADNERAVAEAVRGGGRLEALVGNAGVHDGGRRLGELSGDDLGALARRVLEVDVVGYLQAVRAATEELNRTGGTIVFTLSDASFVVHGNGAGAIYTAAKHAELGLMRHLAAELAPRVRVNAVAPGGVVTGLRAVSADGSAPVYERPAELQTAIRAHNPLGVVLTPAELAPLYRFLSGPGAAGMTGEVLRPDGGLTVR